MLPLCLLLLRSKEKNRELKSKEKRQAMQNIPFLTQESKEAKMSLSYCFVHVLGFELGYHHHSDGILNYFLGSLY